MGWQPVLELRNKLTVYRIEVHGKMGSAFIKEKRIKEWKRKWKLGLIENSNPTWKDLYKEIV
jgi:putative endonuclease